MKEHDDNNGKQKNEEMQNILTSEPVAVGDEYVWEIRREGLTKRTRYLAFVKLFNLLCLSFLIYYNENILLSLFQNQNDSMIQWLQDFKFGWQGERGYWWQKLFHLEQWFLNFSLNQNHLEFLIGKIGVGPQNVYF